MELKDGIFTILMDKPTGLFYLRTILNGELLSIEIDVSMLKKVPVRDHWYNVKFLFNDATKKYTGTALSLTFRNRERFIENYNQVLAFNKAKSFAASTPLGGGSLNVDYSFDNQTQEWKWETTFSNFEEEINLEISMEQFLNNRYITDLIPKGKEKYILSNYQAINRLVRDVKEKLNTFIKECVVERVREKVFIV